MILLTVIAFPLIAAALAQLYPRSRLGADATCIAALITLAITMRAAAEVIAAPTHVLVAIPYWVAMDGLSALMIVLVAFIYVTAAFFSVGYMDFRQNGGSRRYYVNFNLFVFSMLMVPLMQEPNIVWIAVELTTLFSVLLVGFKNTHEALEAAWKYIVLTLMGASIALLGFFLLFWAAGQAGIEHYTWSGLVAVAPRMSPVLLKAAFVFILVGFGAKVGLVPLHTWLPDAHSQAPSPVCALLSGVETTVILYAILRLLPVLNAVPSIQADTWLLTFGLISVGTAAFLLLRITDYKRMFAYSTIEHMGIILTAAGMGGASAHSAAMLQIVGHAVTKSFSFLAAGAVLLLIGNRNIASVRALVRQAPLAGAALLLAGLAIAGAPPFPLFLSEFLILKAGLQNGDYLVVGLLTIFIAIAFFAIMNHVSRMALGAGEPASRDAGQRGALPFSCKITLIVAAVPILVLGVYIPDGLAALAALAAKSLGGG
ncbi:MAG TPA: hydrogenase 4 subunit F [Rhodospirillales bacterium]|nr:hydrogenase 4 subunit F [Rhodospirillales bacterium]